MSTQYKLVKKKNPSNKSAAPKWYAVPRSSTPMDEEATTRAATQDTTFSDVELGASSKLIARFVLGQLLNGQRARIPGLGTFRLTFGSEGVENIDDFDANTMIRNARITFLPDAKIRANLLRDLRFENAGVMEDKVDYASVRSYKQAKGLLPDGPGTGGTPGGGEDPMG